MMKAPEAKPTAKQIQIVELLACDYTVPEIALLLRKNKGDIEKFIERIKDRLGVKTAQGLVAEAHRKAFINILILKKKNR